MGRDRERQKEGGRERKIWRDGETHTEGGGHKKRERRETIAVIIV